MANHNDDEIGRVLHQLMNTDGFEPWARACISLLALTEGIERYTDVEEDNPHRGFAAIAKDALSSNEEAKLLEIAGLVAFEYRAMAINTMEVWHPLTESLNHFVKRQTGRVHVWKEFSPHPKREEIEDWLKQRVYS